MGRDTGQIKQEIEETRGRMGDTVEALGYKADVPARARDAVSGRVESAKSRISGAGSRVSDATPDSGDVRHGARRAKGVAQENPLGLAIGAMAVGFVGGLLIPSTRVEDEKIGPMADQVKEKAKETGQEAVERGKEVARRTADSAKETAREAGREQADGLRGSAQEKAGQVS
jgi:ElaB/YqjD/DUF883 family membrane-anchored ribosome-binding protein